jgi:hypothetical protein
MPEALYARMREKPGIRLAEGRLAPTGLTATLTHLLPRSTLGTRIALISGGLAALCVLAGVAGLHAASQSRNAMDALVQEQARLLVQKSPRTTPPALF